MIVLPIAGYWLGYRRGRAWRDDCIQRVLDFVESFSGIKHNDPMDAMTTDPIEYGPRDTSRTPTDLRTMHSALDKRQ